MGCRGRCRIRRGPGDHPGAGSPDETEDGELVALEMERVRHDDPIERRQLERHREVGDERRDADARERVTERPYLNLRARPSRSTVWIEPVGPRRSARARVNAPSPDPRSAQLSRPQDALPEQPDMVAVVHGDKSGPRESWPRPAGGPVPVHNPGRVSCNSGGVMGGGDGRVRRADVGPSLET